MMSLIGKARDAAGGPGRLDAHAARSASLTSATQGQGPACQRCPPHDDLHRRQVHAHLLVHGGAHDAQGALDVGQQAGAPGRGSAPAARRRHSGKDLAREQLDEGGLAGAVGAEQRHVLALG